MSLCQDGEIMQGDQYTNDTEGHVLALRIPRWPKSVNKKVYSYKNMLLPDIYVLSCTDSEEYYLYSFHTGESSTTVFRIPRAIVCQMLSSMADEKLSSFHQYLRYSHKRDNIVFSIPGAIL